MLFEVYIYIDLRTKEDQLRIKTWRSRSPKVRVPYFQMSHREKFCNVTTLEKRRDKLKNEHRADNKWAATREHCGNALKMTNFFLAGALLKKLVGCTEMLSLQNHNTE